jgi:hypothetical protein
MGITTRREFMKNISLVIIMLLVAVPAMADTLLKFQDGSANVWDNIYEKGGDYCTKKSYGTELCADKRDVVLKKEVPAGTDPQELGGGAAGLQSQSDNMWAAQYDEKAVNAKKSKEAAEDRQKAKARKDKVWVFGEDKVTQMERSGNSIQVKP